MVVFDPFIYAAVFGLFVLCFWRQDLFSTLRYNIISNIYPSWFRQQDKNAVSAVRGYTLYSDLAHRELWRMRKSYNTISRQDKQIGYELGYPQKLSILSETIEVNAKLARSISKMARGDEDGTIMYSNYSVLQDYRALEQIRDVLKQILREWSVEGAQERSQTFSPITEVLKSVPLYDREDSTVLVPGAGLGRLAWEIANMGFCTTSNEFSPYMNLAFRFLLSRSTTSRINQHKVHPFAHWFSHQRTNASLFRSITFPDALPSLFPESRLRHEESDFLRLSPVNNGYDFIVTHYFIDTSHNIISTLRKVHNLLRRGGTWINLGPLLWMSGAQATMELSLEEVLKLSDIIGLEVQKGSRRTIPSEYTRDDTAMMRWVYEAEFWIAVKR